MKRIFILLALSLGLAVFARAENAVFIVNPDGADASASVESIKAILLGTKIRWDGGGVIKLAVLTQGETNDQVMRDYAQRSADQFDKYWKKLVFSGKGIMPVQFADEASMVAYVAKTPGALGYVSPSAATDAVKVLPIQ